MTATNSVYLIEPENIPDRLKQSAQWLCWRGEWSEEKQNLNKVPKAADGGAGSSTNPATWTTFDEALAAVGSKNLDGIGFAGMERTPFVGIDIDNCIDEETGEISAYAMKIVEEFDSYTERTVSGTGLRVWIAADKAPGLWCSNKNAPDRKVDLEVYDRGRFFTVTGWHLDGTPKTIEGRQEALDAFVVREAPPERPKPVRATYNGSQEYRLELDEFLQQFGVTILGSRHDQTSERAYAVVCPWAHEHTGGDTSGTRIGQFPSGALWFKCDHAHCDGRTWEHFRVELDPEAYKPGETVPINLNGTGKAEPGASRVRERAARPPTPTHDELRDRWMRDAPRGPYAHGLGEWRRYEDGIWPAVSETSVKAEIAATIEAAKPEGVKPTASILTSVAELARIRAYVPDESWDADPDILACKNGTLRISPGELLDHSPEHYATSAVPYDYDPDAVPAIWRFFLKETVPEAAEFLQEFAGYSLTTDTSHELALWLFGPPGSGKSTFLAGLQAMLGHRAGVLGLAELERSRFTLADLPGKTLVVASEQPSAYLASTNTLNAIISGEPIPVERKYRDPFTVTPRAKLCWAMNELPRVADANSGLFRRVKVVQFPVLPESHRDPKVKQHIEAEGAGILNWALEGLGRLKERGEFQIPEGVREATANFREGNDIPALFVEDRCARGPTLKTQAGQLYDEYKDWCLDNGHRPQSSTRLAADWERLGFEKRKSQGRAYYWGVGLKLAV